MSRYEANESGGDYYTDGRTNPPEYDEEDDTTAEYVDNGEALQIREGELTEAWIRTDTTGEDLLYERGQLELEEGR